MAGTHPYISGAGNVTQMISQLRKSFPPTVTSDTVKKLGLAPNNESYVINALQYIGVIDSEGKKTALGAKVFSNHKDEDFAKSFSVLVRDSYSDLFELHGDHAWELDSNELITFFRQTDGTSAAIGARQAGLFKVFVGQSGYGDIPAPKVVNGKKNQNNIPKAGVNSSVTGRKKTSDESGAKADIANKGVAKNNNHDLGLTVRIEINLPADGSKDTYDNIFKSIKENLLNG